MKIKTRYPLPRDRCLRFKLVLGANPMWLRGRVVYSEIIADQQVIAGIQFMELSEKNHRSLKTYLATLQDHNVGSPYAQQAGTPYQPEIRICDRAFPRMRMKETE